MISLRSAWLQFAKVALSIWLMLLPCFAPLSAHSQGLVTPGTNAGRAQTSNPHGGRNPRDANGANREMHHRDALGNLCLSVEPLARAHVTNKNVYDHVLIMQNQCPRSIKTRACYTESDDCVDAVVPGNERTEIILGISPMIKDFTYEVREF